MKKNVGMIDKVVRIVIGVAILAAGVYYQNWWGLVGIIPLATAFTGSCGLYGLIGVSTCKTEKK
ncbi:YgaP family membrane protein [Williamwhitmania taraxaci]|uniref:Inner membrane protein YgaP-like transmembrane domain-containing protein n=1 Tax=Williamwhitmania taraxaci TaxID=1640674 RepID=A0A1G6JJQ7_9BACT|nr:DUF2892 domain-containing protein [Williamwhitmania taraxaci]SDC18897.1 Protein of unknown function [Williamwhitmania taraxaci]